MHPMLWMHGARSIVVACLLLYCLLPIIGSAPFGYWNVAFALWHWTMQGYAKLITKYPRLTRVWIVRQLYFSCVTAAPKVYALFCHTQFVGVLRWISEYYIIHVLIVSRLEWVSKETELSILRGGFFYGLIGVAVFIAMILVLAVIITVQVRSTYDTSSSTSNIPNLAVATVVSAVTVAASATVAPSESEASSSAESSAPLGAESDATTVENSPFLPTLQPQYRKKMKRLYYWSRNESAEKNKNSCACKTRLQHQNCLNE